MSETMFKWEFERTDYNDELKLIITEVSDKIPIKKNLFISSNGVTFRINGATGFSDDNVFDLPENGWYISTFIDNIQKKSLEIALPEFHEFCVKTYGSKSETISTKISKPSLKEYSLSIFKTILPEVDFDKIRNIIFYDINRNFTFENFLNSNSIIRLLDDEGYASEQWTLEKIYFKDNAIFGIHKDILIVIEGDINDKQ